MKTKKGASPPTTSAAAISTLVALIALFMVIYILLLPPSERRELLDLETPTNTGSGSSKGTGFGSNTVGEETVLSVSPGRVSLDIEESNEHQISPIRLFSKIQSSVKDIADVLTISRSGFSDKFQELSFTIDDANTLESITLYFFVQETDGNLILDLNGQQIFNSKLEAGKLRTVNLPIHLLSNVNTIKFSASSPGLLFFTKNTHILKNLQLNQKFKVNNIRSERSVSLNAFEIENFDKAYLDFLIYCETLSPSEGRLRVFINDQPLFSDTVICDRGTTHIEIDKIKLRQGQNILDFTIDNGDYTIEQIVLTTEVEGGSLLRYKFFLEEEEFLGIFRGNLDAELFLVFGNDGNKNARFDINGDSIRMDTNGLEFSRDISGLVKQGNNFIKIIPTNDFIIDLMEVNLV